MSTSPNYPVPRPYININLVPEEERAATWIFSTSIGGLASRVDDFKAALDLFDFSAVLARNNFIDRQFRAWKHIALRDGAMTVYHFGRALKEGSGNGLKECPSLTKLLAANHMRQARHMFSQKFPAAEKVRHGTAHSAEIGETKADYDMNAFSGNADLWGVIKGVPKGLMIQDGLAGRRYITTHRGEIISYELSAETLSFLCDIAREFYEAFDAVERFPRHIRDIMAAPASE